MEDPKDSAQNQMDDQDFLVSHAIAEIADAGRRNRGSRTADRKKQPGRGGHADRKIADRLDEEREDGHSDIDGEVEEEEDRQHGGETRIGEETHQTSTLFQGCLGGPGELFPGSHHHEDASGEEDHSPHDERVTVTEGIGQEASYPGPQGHPEKNRHLHEAQTEAESGSRHCRGNERYGSGDGSRRSAGEETQDQELVNVTDHARGHGDDSACEHGPFDHDLAPVAIGKPSPQGREDGHDETCRRRQDTRPYGDEALVRDPEFPDVKRDEGQDEGETHDGKELGREHDGERGFPLPVTTGVLYRFSLYMHFARPVTPDPCYVPCS